MHEYEGRRGWKAFAWVGIYSRIRGQNSWTDFLAGMVGSYGLDEWTFLSTLRCKLINGLGLFKELTQRTAMQSGAIF
ncbi:MAG: hypothetical protein Fur0043_24820 [Anaerolineales bacterium]